MILIKLFIWYGQIRKKYNKKINLLNGQGIAFDGEGSWSFSNNFARNVVIFGVDNCSPSNTDNQKLNFLVIGEGLTKGINRSTDSVEKKISINFSKANKPEVYKFQAKDKISCYNFCLGSESQNFTKDEQIKISFKGAVYDFSVDQS